MKMGAVLCALVLVVSLVTGCGISKDVYGQALSERDTAQEQVTTLQADLTGAQALVTSLEATKAELTRAQETASASLKQTQGELSKVRSEASDFKSSLTPLWSGSSSATGAPPPRGTPTAYSRCR